MNNIKQIEVIYDNRLVGRLALTKEGVCAFEYSGRMDWLRFFHITIRITLAKWCLYSQTSSV